MRPARIWSSDVAARDAGVRRGASWVAAAVLVAITAVAGAAELPSELLRPLCVGCQQPADAARELFSVADWKRLRDGEVLVVDRSRAGGDGGAPKESEAAVIIPRPPAEVWAVLVDFESRPRIWPEVRESRLERVEDNRAWIRQCVEVLWTEIHYTLITTLDPARGVMTFALDRSAPHDIHDSSGSWQIFPDGDGSALLVSRDRVDPGTPLPGMIERYLAEKSLPAMMSHLRQEVERRADRGARPELDDPRGRVRTARPRAAEVLNQPENDPKFQAGISADDSVSPARQNQLALQSTLGRIDLPGHRNIPLF